MRLVLLVLLIAGPALAQTGSPTPDPMSMFDRLESLYAVVDEGAERVDLAALTPGDAVVEEWTAAVQSAIVLDLAMQGLTDSTPVPGLSDADVRAERRVGLSTVATLSAATGAALSTVTLLRLALVAPDARAAAYAAYGRDADALSLLLSNLAYEAADAAVAFDPEVDATLAAFVPRAAVVHELVGKLRAATPQDDR